VQVRRARGKQTELFETADSVLGSFETDDAVLGSFETADSVLGSLRRVLLCLAFIRNNATVFKHKLEIP